MDNTVKHHEYVAYILHVLKVHKSYQNNPPISLFIYLNFKSKHYTLCEKKQEAKLSLG